MARLINYFELKQRILEERDKIPPTLPGATYELGVPRRNHHGDSMRGGIRKALRCLEQCQTADAVEVTRCKDCQHRGEPVSCPMCFEHLIEYDEDGYYDYDYVTHDYTADYGFCDRGERRTDNG